MEKPGAKLNAALDDAIQGLENSGDELKGCIPTTLIKYFNKNLDANVVKKVVDERIINKVGQPKELGEEKDLIGRVYEFTIITKDLL